MKENEKVCLVLGLILCDSLLCNAGDRLGISKSQRKRESLSPTRQAKGEMERVGDVEVETMQRWSGSCNQSTEREVRNT